MIKIGDRVEYWYRMGRVGTVVGTQQSARTIWLEGGSTSAGVDLIVRFDDGKEEAYPASELRLAE